MYLPSLQQLYLQNNKIYQIFQGNYFINNITKLDISNNQIESYISIINFIQNADRLDELDYRDNNFLIECGQNIQEFMIYLIKQEYCTRLKIINNLEINRNNVANNKKNNNWKIEQYKQFTKYIKNRKQLSSRNEQIINIYRINNQQQQYLHHVNHKLIGNIYDYRHTNQIQLNILFDSFKTQRIIQLNDLQNQLVIDKLNKQVNRHQKKYERSLKYLQQFIRSQNYSLKREKRLRNEYLSQIDHILMYKIIIQYRYYKWKRKNNKIAHVIKIQSLIRGFITRRRVKRLFGQIKYQDDELEEFDMDFFNQEVKDEDFELKIPQEMLVLQQQQIEQLTKKNQMLEQQIKIIDEHKPEELFVESVNTTQRTNKQINFQQQHAIQRKKEEEEKKERDNQIVNEWNFSKDFSKQTLMMRMQRERNRKKKLTQKALTAEQRLVKFLECKNIIGKRQ